MGKSVVLYPYNGIFLSHEKEEVLIHATTWMNLKNMMLNKRSQTQKPTYCMIPFIESVQSRRIHRDRKQMSVHQGLGVGRNGSDSSAGRGFLFGMMKRFWNLIEVVFT